MYTETHPARTNKLSSMRGSPLNVTFKKKQPFFEISSLVC